MIDFDFFMPLIKTRAQGVPEPIAINAIRNAATEFCIRTKIWRGTDQFYATNIDSIALPPNSDLVEIADARFNGVRLEPVSFDEMNDRFPNTDWQNMTGDNPKYFTQTELNTIKVIPTCEGYVDLSLILKPSARAKQLPDCMTAYTQTIADGALGEIMSVPNQTYTSSELAIFHMQRFNSQLDRLSSIGITGQIRARIRTKPSYF